ncbi:DUF2452 domain-containing protein [Lewinella cohaerens]|uniref:DUF2452 domain-containing protein n=1 Tax=Lewinella cohaerens TaxID=70995 RepID=UPI000377BECB|nr:DUF2452 domain-containing protein [Lewinella cohaerens]
MSKEQEKKKTVQEENWVNPIDPEKIAENPHLLPYAHTVGGAVIKPIDKGRVKGRAVAAMYEQTDLQLAQIKEQIDLLAQQARKLQDRVSISEEIYQTDMNFEPLIGRNYYLYRKGSGKTILSMVSPNEWGKKPPYTFVAEVKMLADHTWDVLRTNEDEASKQ